MRPSDSRKGNASVEFVLVGLLLIALSVGAIDFGRSLHEAISVAGSARAGAAFGSISPGASEVPPMIELRTVAESEATYLGGTDGVSAQAEQWCECPGGGLPVACTAQCAGYGEPRTYVRVDANREFGTLGRWPGIPEQFTMRRSVVMRAR